MSPSESSNREVEKGIRMIEADSGQQPRDRLEGRRTATGLSNALRVPRLSFYHLYQRSHSKIRTLSRRDHLVLDHLDQLRSKAFPQWARAQRTARLSGRPSAFWAMMVC